MEGKRFGKAAMIFLLTINLILTLFFVVIPNVSASTGCFDDTNGHIFEQYICWMDDNGITSGCGGGKFCPEDNVTRGQMSVFIKRVFDLAEANDDDTLDGLGCSTDQIAKWNGSAWVCAPDVDTDTDTLASLSCSTDEIVRWNGSAWICDGSLEDRIAALETLLSPVSLENGGDDFVFTGVNVHVRDGTGDTDGTVNGLGNLIVGYNEDTSAGGTAARTGSHNLVLGEENEYTRYGGFVGGYLNTISGDYSSVISGSGNTASGYRSSVSGGQNNTASGGFSVVSGGYGRSVSGGWNWRAGDLFEDN